MLTREKLEALDKEVLITMVLHERAATISKPIDLYGPIASELEALQLEDQENFFVITLNGAHKIINMHVVTKGLVNRTQVHPREVFRPAIRDNATAVIVGHNHPSGNVEPSGDDRDVTRRLRQAGELLGIKVLDHLILGGGKTLSMLEAGVF